MTETPAPKWLIASAFVGGLIIAAIVQLHIPVHQRLLDGALVAGGWVKYPAQTPMNEYFLGMWTLLHQLGAAALATGMSYSSANFLFSVLPPAFIVSGYAMMIYGLTRSGLFAIVAAIGCFLIGTKAPFFASPDYPFFGFIWILPTPHSYGWYAAALSVWTIGCLAGGRPALAIASALVLVAVHPVVGSYILVLCATALVIARLFWKVPYPPRIFLGFSVGIAVCFISFALYLFLRPALPPVSAAQYSADFQTYISLWDQHRAIVSPMKVYARVGLSLALLIGMLGVFLQIHRPRQSVDIAALALILVCLVSGTLFFWLHFARNLMPGLFVNANPGRLLNIHAYMVPAIIIGLMGWGAKLIVQKTLPARPGAVPVLMAIMAVLFTIHARPSYSSITRMALQPPVADPYEGSFWSRIRAMHFQGMVLVEPGLVLDTLRYGRLAPVLDTSALDFVPYLPSTAGGVGLIIEKGYGVSFRNPPDHLRNHAILPEGVSKAYWACLSPTEWATIGRDLHIGAVVAPADWTIQLPRSFSDQGHSFYAIPVSGAASRPSCPIAHK